MTDAINSVWMAAIVAECATAVVLYRRRAQASYPAFFSLLIFMIANSVVLAGFSMLSLPTAYFYTYWLGLAFRAILVGGVIGELSLEIFRPSGLLPAHTPRISMLAAGIIVVLSMLFIPQSGPQYMLGICARARAANQTISWVILIILAVVMVLSGLLGMRWNRRAVGITLGLLVELWIGSLTASVAALFGSAIVGSLNWIRLVAFVVTNCIWIASFLVPDSEIQVEMQYSQ